MSDIGINFQITTLDILRWYAAGAFLYGAIPVLLAALSIFIVPSWRRKRGTRRFAYSILGIIAILGVIGAPGVLYEAERELGPLFRRLELAEPRTVDGIAFPAGTRLQMNKYGKVESGIFPGPTPVQGLLLTGRFEVEHGLFGFEKPRIWAGTLARAAEIEGVPCAEGPFKQPDWTSPPNLKCRLAREFDFLGYPLAKGSLVELYPAFRPTRLDHGILSRPMILFDIGWPAGTAVAPDSDAATLRHAALADRLARLCVPQGGTVTISGAEVHGAMHLLTGGLQTSLWSDPGVIAENCPDAGAPGYALQNGKRQTQLDLQNAKKNADP